MKSIALALALLMGCAMTAQGAGKLPRSVKKATIRHHARKSTSKTLSPKAVRKLRASAEREGARHEAASRRREYRMMLASRQRALLAWQRSLGKGR